MQVTDPHSETFRFGAFELDLETRELRKHGIRIKLQEQPLHILILLLRHPGRLISRDELRHALWSDHTFVDFDRNLNRAMNKLRVALCDSAEHPRFIETVPRRGYRFIAPLTVETKGAGNAQPRRRRTDATSITGNELSTQAEITARSTIPSLHSGVVQRSLWAGTFAFLMACGIGTWYVFGHSASASSASSMTPRRSVAVLGFKNLSGRHDKTWVSTALADWLTTDLSAGGQLRTLSGESVARMKLELAPLDIDNLDRASLARIGKNLATDLVVVGSYAVLDSGSDPQVRLDLRLRDTQSGETIEAVSVQGTEAHLLDLVSRAGGQLRVKLGVQAVSPQEAAEVAVALPSDHRAARLYSEGLQQLRLFNTLDARDLFQQTIAIEPKYALGHSALATSWSTLGYDDLAQSEARKAFELSSNLPRSDRLLVEARYREASKDWGKAAEIYRALFEFFPDNLDYGLALANAQFNEGRGQDALDTLAQLQKLPAPLGEDPRIDLLENRAAESLGQFKRDLAATIRAADKASAMRASLLLAEARADQAWALSNLGSWDQASIAAEEAKNIFASVGDKRGVALTTNFSGIVLENQGNALGAKQHYEEALSIYGQIGNKLGVANELDNLGDVLLALGDLQASRQEYEQSMRAYREIGHENGVCLTKGALGPVLLGLGDQRGSVETSQEAFEICQRLGDESKAGLALAALARALRAEGESSEAKSAASHAISMFHEIGDTQNASRAELTLAELYIDAGNLKDAQAILRTAYNEFEKDRATRDAALASAILSQSFLRTGKVNAAQEAIANAKSDLARCHDREAELFVAIAEARIQAAAGGAAAEQKATESLHKIASEADRIGFVPYQFEPRLAIAEIQLTSGEAVEVRGKLEDIRKEAAERGLGLIALQAASDLKAIPIPAHLKKGPKASLESN